MNETGEKRERASTKSVFLVLFGGGGSFKAVTKAGRGVNYNRPLLQLYENARYHEGRTQQSPTTALDKSNYSRCLNSLSS